MFSQRKFIVLVLIFISTTHLELIFVQRNTKSPIIQTDHLLLREHLSTSSDTQFPTEQQQRGPDITPKMQQSKTKGEDLKTRRLRVYKGTEGNLFSRGWERFLLWNLNKSSPGKRWWVCFCFSSYVSQISPKGDPSEEPGSASKKNSKRNTALLSWRPGKGELESQLYHKISPSPGAVVQWPWSKRPKPQ